MSIKLHTIALFFYNFFCLSCLSFSGNKYKTSTAMLVVNVLKMLVCDLSITASSFSNSFIYSAYKQEFLVLPRFSVFTQYSMLFSVVFLTFFSVGLFVLQVVQRNKIESFMNETLKLTLKDGHNKSFRWSACRKTAILSTFFVVFSTLRFFAMMKLNFASMFLYLLLIFPSCIVFVFVNFVNNTEAFVVGLLKQIKSDLSRCFGIKSREGRIFGNISKRHFEIFRLVEHFNVSFGLQLTMVTCSLIIISVFGVSRNHRIKIMKIFFQTKIIFYRHLMEFSLF